MPAPRRKKGSFEILFVGYNSVSIPFAHTLVSAGVEVSITFYHGDTNQTHSDKPVRAAGKAQVQRKGSRSRRDSSFSGKQRRRTASSRPSTVAHAGTSKESSTSLRDLAALESLFTASRLRGKKPKVIHNFSNLKLSYVKFIFFASSTAYMNSKRASELKKHLANKCSPDCVWVRLSMNPETNCLLTGNSATDNNRYFMAAMPLYTVLKSPAGKEAVAIKFWHEAITRRKGRTVWPIFLSSLYQERAKPRSVDDFVARLSSKAIMVAKAPSIGNTVNSHTDQKDNKTNHKVYTHTINLQLDIEKRHWLLPLYLLIEFESWSGSIKKLNKGKRGINDESKVDREELNGIAFEAFHELYGMDKGIMDIFSTYTHAYLSGIKEVLEQQRVGSQTHDNSASTDVVDAFNRINELRYELDRLVSKKSIAAQCKELVKRTDVNSKYGNKRVWNKRDLAYIYT